MPSRQQRSQDLHRVAECLYRNGNGNYVALVKVKGKQIKRSLKTIDRKIANRRLADLREKAQRLYGSENRNIRFGEFAEIWLESVKPDLKVASYQRRATAMEGLRPFFEGIQVRSIGVTEIERWKKQRGAHIAARTHNIELETLSLIFRYAKRRGIILENPCDDFNRRKEIQRQVETLSRGQFCQLMGDLRNSSKAVFSGAADMIEFLAYSGLRIGEARQIRWNDVNFRQNTIRVTGGEGGTKNHRERSITMYPNLRKLLERIGSRDSQRSSDSRLFEIRSPRKALDLACKRLGFPRFRVHALRHFFATNAIEEGVNFRTVANWLGHADGGILVSKTYGHLRQDFSEEAAKKMTFEA